MATTDAVSTEDTRTAHATQVLVLTSIGVFIVFLDTTIVNVAFDTIGASFDAALATLVWVLNAYTLVFAATLMPAGYLVDRCSRKTLFQTGLIGFLLGSAACGLAPDVTVLVIARIVQAVFGALIVPSSLALLLHAFPRERRASAISTWGAMAAVATAIGPTCGALLIEYGSWRLVFLINLPICLLAALWAARLLPRIPAPSAAGLPDPVGVLLSAAAPALLSFGIIYGPRIGWTDPRVAGSIAAGIILLPVFHWRTTRARNPFVDLSLFRIRDFQASNIATLVFSVAFFGVLLSSLLFLQNVWHYSVLMAALATSPAAVVTAVVAPRAGQLAERFGYRVVFTLGALCYSAGIAFLAMSTSASPQWLTHWLPALVVNGIGVGLALSTLNSGAARALPENRFGVGFAINNSFRQLGALLGVSVLVAVLGDPTPASILGDYHRGWWVLAGVPVLSALAYCWVLRERPRSPLPDRAG